MVPGEDAVECAVVIGNGQGAVFLLVLHDLPCVTHGNGGVQHRGTEKIQIPDLIVHIINTLRGLEAEPVQHHLGLIGDLT